ASCCDRKTPQSAKDGSFMAQQRLGIIMNGVTGRMGMNQHLIRSIVAIREQGGVPLKNGDRVMPDPILVGRNAERVQKLAKAHGISRWTTDLDTALKDKKDTLFFDAATTQLRAELLKKDEGRQAHLLREAGVGDLEGRARPRSRRQEGRHQTRRGAGQTVP